MLLCCSAAFDEGGASGSERLLGSCVGVSVCALICRSVLKPSRGRVSPKNKIAQNKYFGKSQLTAAKRKKKTGCRPQSAEEEQLEKSVGNVPLSLQKASTLTNKACSWRSFLD